MAMRILLVDNGSLAPAATLSLRDIAQKLSAVLGDPVEPVSALHSGAIAPGLLGGQPAEILEPAVKRRITAGATEFLIVLLFFGDSGGVKEYIPSLFARLREKTPGLRVVISQPLGADERIAAILHDRVARIAAGISGPPAVIVVDHGSPLPSVTAVRDEIAAKLKRRLGSSARAVQPASMERRKGAQYDFNDPLLAAAFERPGFNSGDVIVALLFLAAGRHAGPGGDIERICAAAEKKHPGLRVHRTAPIGDDPRLIEILADRVRESM